MDGEGYKRLKVAEVTQRPVLDDLSRLQYLGFAI
jgi:hypothetical protein